MKETEKLKKFLEEYEQYAVNVLKRTSQEIKALFTTWLDSEYWGQQAPLSRLGKEGPVQSH